MSHSFRAERTGSYAYPLLALCLWLAGCGLGMDDAERLERARAAFENGDYRVTVIDSKTILQRDADNREARLLLGRAALRMNDPGTAEKELRRAVSLGTGLDAVAVDLGLAMLARGEYEQLLAEIEPALGATEADRLSIHRLRGDALMALQRSTEARAGYEAALAIDPDDLASIVGVAASRVAEMDYAQARSALDRAIALDPDYVPAHLLSASLHMTRNDPAGAEAEYAKAAELSAAAGRRADQATALAGRVEAQLALGDLDAAKSAMADLEKIAPQRIPTTYLRARVAFAAGDFETANAELQKVLAATPESEPARFLMGAVQLQRGNLAQAEMYLSPLVGRGGYDKDARKLLAQLRLRQDRADEAADLLRPLLDANGADLAALNLAVRASLAAGETNEAVDVLRRALANDPDNTDIRLDLAATYLASGEVDAAEALLADSGGAEADAAAYRRAFLSVLAPLRRGDATSALEKAREMAARWPADPRVRNLIGGIALELDDRALARQSFVEARDLDPDGLTAYLSLAKLEEDAGDLDAARKQYAAALARHPQSPRLMLARGQLEARAGDEAAAVDWLEKARAADATALAPRIVLARYYLAGGKYALAETAASEAVGIDARNAEANNLLGLALQGQGNLSAAVQSFARAADLAPDENDYRLNEVRAQAALGNIDEARNTLLGNGELDLGDLRSAVMAAGLEARDGNAEAALRIARELQGRYPGQPVPFALEAELLAKAGRFAEGAAAYDKALSLRGNDRRLVVRAYRLRVAGGLPSPEQPLLAFLEKAPDDADVRVVLAQEYQRRGESGSAIAAYERALAAAPGNFVALNNLAWEYFTAGDPRAEETAERAYEHAPDNASVVDTLGWIRVQKGELKAGIASLRKAVELDGDNPEIRYHLAAGLAAAGEKAEARQVLDVALSGGDFAGREEAERLRESL